MILLARSGRDVWKAKKAEARKTDLLIMTGEPQKIPVAGMSLAVSPYRFNTFSPLIGIRSLNYLEQVLVVGGSAGQRFRRSSHAQRTRRNCFGNDGQHFLGQGWHIHTPSLSTGAMAGVTRGAVIELAEKQFIPVIEGVYELGDLTEADEIFLTSASFGVAVVTTFDFRRYSAATSNLCNRLSDALKDLASQNKA